MTFGLDPTEIVACALRPTGTWNHFSSLVGFVVVAWFVSPAKLSRPGAFDRFGRKN